MKNRILLVEDEESLLNTIKLNLELEGYEVITAITGKKAITEFKRQRIDAIILDVMLLIHQLVMLTLRLFSVFHRTFLLVKLYSFLITRRTEYD